MLRLGCNYGNFPVINRETVNVRVRFAGMPLEIRIGARACLYSTVREMTNARVCAVRAHRVHCVWMCTIVGWPYASDRNGQPASRPANRLYYYAVAPCNSRESELNVRKARRHYRANKGFL